MLTKPRPRNKISRAFKKFPLNPFLVTSPSKAVNRGSCSVVSSSLQPRGLYSPWNSPGQNTGVGSLPLLQGIFPTQGSNPGLLRCRQILYQLSHQGSPKQLNWLLTLLGNFAYCCSVIKSCLSPWDPVDCSTPGLPVPHHLPEFAQTHVHWISDAIQ